MVSEPARMLACFLLLLLPLAGTAALQDLEDQELGEVHAQGLIVTDRISGSSLANPNEYSSPFTFYRMGLDGELSMNLNMSKLQLGCGGINDYLTRSPACDMDLDYVSLMGRNGNAPGAPVSDFTLKRPYIEIAVKNDGTPNREIVGVKIGAQSADGALSVGRRYTTNGATNFENPASASTCVPGTTPGDGVLGCHSGINALSGFMSAEMSITMNVKGRLCASVLIGGSWCGITNLLWVNLDAYGCKGRTVFAGDDCGTALNDALFVDVAGTRMQNLGLAAAQLNLVNANGTGLGGLAADLLGNVYAEMNANLRLLHYVVFDNTSDFFLSFQREPVAYPRFSKLSPNADPATPTFDACNTAYATARCNSAYAVTANSGWWMNAPNVKLLDIGNSNGTPTGTINVVNMGNLNIGDALALLAAPGYLVDNPEFNLSPADNCYGTMSFC
jgi:hypothetical protein